MHPAEAPFNSMPIAGRLRSSPHNHESFLIATRVPVDGETAHCERSVTDSVTETLQSVCTGSGPASRSGSNCYKEGASPLAGSLDGVIKVRYRCSVVMSASQLAACNA